MLLVVRMTNFVKKRKNGYRKSLKKNASVKKRKRKEKKKEEEKLKLIKEKNKDGTLSNDDGGDDIGTSTNQTLNNATMQATQRVTINDEDLAPHRHHSMR